MVTELTIYSIALLQYGNFVFFQNLSDNRVDFFN